MRSHSRYPLLKLACFLLCTLFAINVHAKKKPKKFSPAWVKQQHTQWRTTPRLRHPPTLEASGGVLDTTLTVKYAANQIAGDPVWLRSYNGQLVGPTLRVRPGDLMKILMSNELPDTEDSKQMPGMSHHVMMPAMKHMGTKPRAHASHGSDDGIAGDTEPGWNDPHAFNVTNLHTHGLWVSPAGNSDNVLISIYPGQSFQNEIHVPADHPPGTHWYHPHRHGSVSMQVSSGMSGLVIIEGGLDEVSAIKAAQEQLMVLQQIAYDPDDCLHVEGDTSIDVRNRRQQEMNAGCIESYVNTGPNHWPYLDGTSDPKTKPRFTTINGQVHPTVLMQPGEVQRWRLLHAGIRESINLAIVAADKKGNLPDPIEDAHRQPLHVIAEDGIAYGFREEFTKFQFDPGNRLDLLVQLDRGRYYLIDDTTPADDSLHVLDESLKTLAFIDVDGPELQMNMPSNPDLAGLAPYPHVKDTELTNPGSRCQKMQFDLVVQTRLDTPPIPPPPAADNPFFDDYNANTEACRRANEAAGLGVDEDGTDHRKTCFFVNGAAFSEERTARQVQLRQASMHAPAGNPGANADEWQLSSLFVNHPFHIHVNPFEIQNPPHHDGHSHPPHGLSTVWKDTFMVQADDTGDKGEFIRARTRYRRYIGSYVLHCHILDHEDQGMMEEVEVMPLPPDQQERYICELPREY